VKSSYLSSLLHDDRLDVLQAPLVERQDGITGELGLLELGDHVPIIPRRKMSLPRDPRGDRRHLALVLREGGVRHPADLRGRDVDAVILEIQRVLFRRQAEIGARAGQ
jgi:hypothetical protein